MPVTAATAAVGTRNAPVVCARGRRCACLLRPACLRLCDKAVLSHRQARRWNNRLADRCGTWQQATMASVHAATHRDSALQNAPCTGTAPLPIYLSRSPGGFRKRFWPKSWVVDDPGYVMLTMRTHTARNLLHRVPEKSLSEIHRTLVGHMPPAGTSLVWFVLSGLPPGRPSPAPAPFPLGGQAGHQP
jgi:hypothetical protein